MRKQLHLLALLLLTSCGAPLSEKIVDTRLHDLNRLGAAIPKEFLGKEALVIVNPLGHDEAGVRALESATLEALDKAIRGKLKLVTVQPALKEGAATNIASFAIPPGSSAPLSFLMKEDAFTTLAAENPKAALIISIVGYPEGGLKHKHPPAILLYPDLRAFGTHQDMQNGFADGHLIAFVLRDAKDRVITRANAVSIPW